jgi:hypothetical protein
MGRALQKEASHGLCVPLFDIFTERKEQFRGAASIQSKRRLLGSSMRLEPVTKGGNKNWIGGLAVNWLELADPAPYEVLVEKLHSKWRVIANPSSLEMRASTPIKMAAKGIKHLDVEIRQHMAFALNEAAEMGGCSNVANSAGRCVCIAFEIVCKRVDVRSTDSSAQAT